MGRGAWRTFDMPAERGAMKKKIAVLLSLLLLGVGTPALAEEDPALEPYTIAVIPDTQYATASGHLFEDQTEWLVENRERLNLVFVAHEGDVVNDMTAADQWQSAEVAFDNLADAGIPFAVAPGNHDILPVDAPQNETTEWDEHMAGRVQASVGYGGSLDGSTSNTWHTFSAGGVDYLVLGLQFGPSTDVLLAARQQAAALPDHTAILLTHDYLDSDGTLRDFPTDAAAAGRVAGQQDGVGIWADLVSPASTIRYTLNGHVEAGGTSAYTVSTRADGSRVHQMMANYQTLGATAHLRLLTFYPQTSGEPVVRAQTVDVVTDKHLTDSRNRFFLTGTAPYPFPDTSGIFNEEVTLMQQRGVVKGYPDGYFYPQADVSRQAAAAMIWRTWGEPDRPCTAKPYADVTTGNEFCWAITRLKQEGYISQTATNFSPTAPISRQAFAAFMFKPEGTYQSFFTDVGPDHPFARQITAAYRAGIVSGYPVAGGSAFRSSELISRQAAAAMVARLYYERRLG